MGEEEFIRLVGEKMLEAEMELNKDMRLRWHVTETKPLRILGKMNIAACPDCGLVEPLLYPCFASECPLRARAALEPKP